MKHAIACDHEKVCVWIMSAMRPGGRKAFDVDFSRYEQGFQKLSEKPVREPQADL